jgi:lipoprotein signal peptidase
VSPLALLIATALVGFAADQLSKVWAFTTDPNAAGPREIAPGLVTGVLARNDGAMANLAGGLALTAPLCALQGVALFGMAAWGAQRRRDLWGPHDAAFAGLLGAGMLGNAADRLALGYVRDFLVATPCPGWIFNLADVFILAGFLLLLGSWAAARLVTTGGAGPLRAGPVAHPGPAGS